MYLKNKGRAKTRHPYLSGNFAPIQKTLPLTICSFEGYIPQEFEGGQYVRNGANPISNQDLGREAHWFDGDGMLSGVAFRRTLNGKVRPHFVNQFILTDVLLSAADSPIFKRPILPSIASLVNPASNLIYIFAKILRTFILVSLSFLPGSTQSIKRISVANTGIFYHDGRALATCESGPPIRVSLPGLETVGWFNGHYAEGEFEPPVKDLGFGGEGILSFMKEWTTGHPKVDPITNEMILYHCNFTAPYVNYSVIPPQHLISEKALQSSLTKILNVAVPGVSGAKMMHDFGVSQTYTVIMDLPLSLDPLNLLKGRPVVHYDPAGISRYGIFPRRNPAQVRWYETSACCIFHSANCWDEPDNQNQVKAVNMLVCRLTSASLVFAAGNITAPRELLSTDELSLKAESVAENCDQRDGLVSGDGKKSLSGRHSREVLETTVFDTTSNLKSQSLKSSPPPSVTSNSVPLESDQCRLYYYRFDLSSPANEITQQFALSAIPLDFPILHPKLITLQARYVYGCSTTTSGFSTALGKAVKIDILAKIDIVKLLRRAEQFPPESVIGCVDSRSVAQILKDDDSKDHIRLFRMPSGWYAQEARFVPRMDASAEDEGFLVFYAFDESQLDEWGDAPKNASSELWILDAKSMRDIVCRIKLPQRVPYGLHGCWFPKEEVEGQKRIESTRRISHLKQQEEEETWVKAKERLIRMLD